MNLMGTTAIDYGMNLTRYLEAEWDGLGTTRGAWCRKVGLADSTVLRWAQGIEPDMKNLRLIAPALGLTLTQVLVICGYETEQNAKVKAPEPRTRPTVAEAIELDPTINDDERAALRAMHDALVKARDGRKRTTRITNAKR
jgi:transcriptional regulator with XRE-family HTH domain